VEIPVMNYYASVNGSNSVHLYKDENGTPISTFGYGCGIISALVVGNTEIYCQTKTGNTLVYKISGNSVSLVRSFR
jgi:hypothetical protein